MSNSMKMNLNASLKFTQKDKDGNLIVVRAAQQDRGFGIKGLLVRSYHINRIIYAQKMRGKTIKMDYRTGENVPSSYFGLLKALFILKYRRALLWLTHHL